MAVHAYEEAAAHFQRSLDVLGRMPSDEARRCQLLISLGDARSRAGDAEPAAETFCQAAKVAKKIGDAASLARAALGFGRAVPIVVVGPNVQHVRLLEEALDALGENETPLRIRVMARLASELITSDEAPERGDDVSREAVEIARRVGDKQALGAALSARLSVSWGTAKVEERAASATEVLRLAEETQDRELALQAYLRRVMALIAAGDLRGADRDIEAFTRSAEDLRQPYYLSFTHILRAVRAAMSGRFADAEAELEPRAERGRVVKAVEDARFLHHFRLLREQGRLAEIVDALDAWAKDYTLLLAYRSSQAMIASELGRETEVRRLFESLAAHDFRELRIGPARRTALSNLCEVCHYLGDTRRAALLYPIFLPDEGEFSAQTSVFGCLNPVSHYLGLLATTLGRFDDAERHFEDSLTKAERLQAPPWIARTRYCYAEMLLRRGGTDDREKALSLLGRSLTTADELGMRKLLGDAQALQAKASAEATAEATAAVSTDAE
ncbi:MAG: hypothetical protein ACREQ9_12275, partial [Candidatus Binatia bacterium]